MEQLDEPLAIPNINGKIIARYTSGKSYWVVIFLISGPDYRYNPGALLVEPTEVPSLITALQEAFDRISILEKQSFLGTFSKVMPTHNAIELVATQGRAYVKFWAPSDTNRFYKILNANELQIAINELRTVENRGAKMLETLKMIA